MGQSSLQGVEPRDRTTQALSRLAWLATKCSRRALWLMEATSSTRWQPIIQTSKRYPKPSWAATEQSTQLAWHQTCLLDNSHAPEWQINSQDWITTLCMSFQPGIVSFLLITRLALVMLAVMEEAWVQHTKTFSLLTQAMKQRRWILILEEGASSAML